MPDRARLSGGYRFPAGVIAHAVQLDLRFALTLRDVGALLAECAPMVSYEASGPGVFAVGDPRRDSAKRVVSTVGEGSVVVQAVLRRPGFSVG